MSRTLVLGVDAGATSTRCVVATLDGVVVARGTAGGANRNSSGGRTPETLTDAIGAALAVLPASDRPVVRLGVLGGAGSAGAGRALFRAAAAQAWTDAGLTGEMVTVTDLEVAFAAGTAAPTGALLLSGTGALAARFADGKLVRRCDGYGWLLGDEGSAVWMGVRALRTVLAALDGRGEPTALVGLTCEQLGIALPAGTRGPGGEGRAVAGPHGGGPPGGEAGAGGLVPAGLSRSEREAVAQAVIAAGFGRAPAELGLLAPAVSAAAEAGDPVARRITDGAAARLLHALDTVEPPPGGDVVLAGSVLLSAGPVARAVRDGVLARTGAEPRAAVDGAAGAVALAIARVGGHPVSGSVHARLTGGAGAGRGHEPGRG